MDNEVDDLLPDLTDEQLAFVQEFADQVVGKAFTNLEEQGYGVYKREEIDTLVQLYESMRLTLTTVNEDLDRMFDQSNYVTGNSQSVDENVPVHSHYKVFAEWPEYFWYIDSVLDEATPLEVEVMEFDVEAVVKEKPGGEVENAG